MANKSWRDEEWAKKIPGELAESLDNFEHDDGSPPTLSQAVQEAEYILKCFREGGHALNDSLNSDDPKDVKWAKEEMRDLRSFIKQHESGLRKHIRKVQTNHCRFG